MEPTVRFRVLTDHEVKKLTLNSGIPSTVDELVAAIKEQFAITTEISLQYKDEEFDNFFTLTTTKELKDKDTLKVVYVPLNITLTFSHNTELALSQGNEIYLRDGTLLTSPSVKADILERLAEAMFCYTAYPNDAQRSAVAQALIETHPCLKEPGSFNGIYGWQQSLKYKCGNYRTKRKAMGSPELLINSMKYKMGDDRKPAKYIKKPKRAEVNYLPQHLSGETDSSLENVRLGLVEASKKRDVKSINDMMARTYSWRRMEVVVQSPDVAKFKERWPALFEPFQINEEFRRCAAVPLESVFMSQLDKYTPKLLDLFSVKGGAVGQRIKNLLMELIQDPSTSVVKKRDVTLRCLIEYMGESGQELISDYYGKTESSVHEDLKMRNMQIYVCREPDAVGVIIEGIPVLTDLGNLARACCLLLGMTYALNLQYPPQLCKTFEVFQRLFVGLDTLHPKPSYRFMTLKNKTSELVGQMPASHS
ncbi:uncharacterized protein LOC127524567 isoform X1 [Ctenopharyngodon idella]|uniref:uncharacterized protein LOC127524567 isoform X1 n=1 Tax=Ctenopharyngodon idella TaxID=7959 RepID=UPI00222E9528|nr:uncharacterized protein LOC127524567 isoform X1 [Ctenopharyngodon idella]